MPVTPRSTSHNPPRELPAFLEQSEEEYPEATAEKILAYNGPIQQLIGITNDGNRVYYFKFESNAIICLKLEHQCFPEEGLVTGKVTKPSELKTWVHKYGSYLGWIHPRYR